MTELAYIINKYFLKILKPIFKWSLIVGIMIVAGFGLSQMVLLPVFKPSKETDEKVQIRKNSDGKEKIVYGDKATPTNYDQEMSMPAGQLIYQNQARFYKAMESENEDIQPGAKIQPREWERLRKLTKGFLAKWETYSVDQDMQQYQNSLAPYVDSQRLQEIVGHDDDRAGEAVGVGKQTGSKAYKTSTYSYQLRILRYDGNTAYATLVAPVFLTGPSLQWSRRSFNKTYSFVYKRIGYDWKITRAAAQVLGEVEHFEPADPPKPKG